MGFVVEKTQNTKSKVQFHLKKINNITAVSTKKQKEVISQL